MCCGGIILEAAVPFRAQGDRLKGADKERYFKLLERADKVTYVSEKYNRGVYHVRNRYMVDNSELLICYWGGKGGGTAYTVEYAQKQGLRIVNIADIGK